MTSAHTDPSPQRLPGTHHFRSAGARRRGNENSRAPRRRTRNRARDNGGAALGLGASGMFSPSHGRHLTPRACAGAGRSVRGPPRIQHGELGHSHRAVNILPGPETRGHLPPCCPQKVSSSFPPVWRSTSLTQIHLILQSGLELLCLLENALNLAALETRALVKVVRASDAY